jgi:hypothetical protein
MSVPVARNIGSGTYCDQCLNAGGPWDVYGSGQWPNGRHGVCGDRASGEGAGYHEGGGRFEQTVGIRVTHYHAGDTITIRGKLTANHLGYMQYYLCRLPDNSAGGSQERKFLTNDCFKGNALRVQQDGSWSDRFYVSGSLSDFQHPLQLPDTPCARCVLRWYYLTGNSCTPPGTPAKWANTVLGICGTGGANPEEFWNCADIAILRKGEPVPAVSRLKIRGELSTGEAAPSLPNQIIEDPETGEVFGSPQGSSVLGSPGDSSGLSVNALALSVVVGVMYGIPVVVISSPVAGMGVGACACLVVLLILVVGNNRGK